MSHAIRGTHYPTVDLAYRWRQKLPERPCFSHNAAICGKMGGL